MKEIEAATKQLKCKKAPGPDGITNDLIKHLGPAAKKTLLELFNESWKNGTVPALWKKATIIPISRKGKDKKDPNSYRPISLLSCLGKLLEQVINRRLISFLEEHLCVPQNQPLAVCRGFVPDIQVCVTHGREDLVNATITSNAEEEEAVSGRNLRKSSS